MNVTSIIYDDAIVAVALVEVRDAHVPHLAMRWLPPQPYRDQEGQLVPTTNLMGGATDWFVLPFTFAAGVCKELVELKVTGMEGFSEEGFKQMLDWLVEVQEINDAMCY